MNDIQTRKKDLTKQQIIKAATKVFGDKRFEDASISEIAKLAEVAEGTIYQHFKNKEDLLFSIPEEMTNTFTEGLSLHLQGIPEATTKISKFAWYYLYFFKTNPEYAQMVMLEMRVNRNFQKTKGYRLFRGWGDLLLDVIKEGQKAKTIRKDINPYVIRELLLGVLEHYVTRWLLKNKDWDLLEFHDQTVKLVLDGIKRKAIARGKSKTARKTRAEESLSAKKEVRPAGTD
jgi:TetR/AcrR family transcriptional regulator, fatty acid metabolism regulator protein